MGLPGLLLRRVAPPTRNEVSSTTLTLRGASNFSVISSGAGNQNVSTIRIANAKPGMEIILTGLDATKTVTLITGGNIIIPTSQVLGLGTAVSLKSIKLSGTLYWVSIGSGFDLLKSGSSTTGTLIRKVASSYTAGGLEEYVIQSGTVSLATTALTTSGIDIGADIPAGATITGVALRILSTISAVTTSKALGIGVAADPDSIEKTSALTTSSAINIAPFSYSATARDLKVFPVQDSSGTAGNIGGSSLVTGSIAWMIVYQTMNTSAL